MTREAITRAVEAHGVVAIIRMKEPDRLRAVIDALAAGDWIRAGAVAVGVGSALLDNQAIAASQYHRLEENALRIVSNVRAARI